MQPKFRKMKRDVQKLRKLNTSYRRKARRLKKLYNVDLDYQVMYIDDFTSRDQFNKYVKQMEQVTTYSSHRYVKNKNDMVVEREVWQRYKDLLPKINEMQKEHLDKLLKTLKEKYGYTPNIDQIRMMGDSKFDRYLPVEYSFDNYTNPDFFKDHLKTLEKMADPLYHWRRDRLMKQNFILAIERSLGSVGKELVDEIESMSITDFAHFYYINDIPLFGYVYSFEEAVKIAATLLAKVRRFKRINNG